MIARILRYTKYANLSASAYEYVLRCLVFFGGFRMELLPRPESTTQHTHAASTEGVVQGGHHDGGHSSRFTSRTFSAPSLDVLLKFVGHLSAHQAFNQSCSTLFFLLSSNVPRLSRVESLSMSSGSIHTTFSRALYATCPRNACEKLRRPRTPLRRKTFCPIYRS